MTEKEEPGGFKFDVEEFRALNNEWARLPRAEAMEAMRQYYVGVAKFFPEIGELAGRTPRKGRARIYLETTMFNWYFEENHLYAIETRRLFARILEGGIDAYTSTTVVDELLATPEPKRGQMQKLITSHGIKVLVTEQDALDLADTYIDMGIISAKSRTDGIHIAVATINNMDYIISFNFKHINRNKTKVGVEAANRMRGFISSDICTPMEVIYDI